jgi:hypothetical protein
MTANQPPMADPRAWAEYLVLKRLPNTNTRVAAEFIRLFGFPPVVNIADIKIYNAILEGLAEEERPQSFLVRILVRDVADLVYQRLWLGRLGARLISQAQMDDMKKESGDIMDWAIRTLDGGSQTLDRDRFLELKEFVWKHVEFRSEHLCKKGTDDGTPYFLNWIENYERVQRLLAAADKRLKDTLKLLDEYREGLGQRVHQLANSVAAASLEPLCSPKRRQLPRLTGGRRSVSTTSRPVGRSNQRAQSAAKRNAIT